MGDIQSVGTHSQGRITPRRHSYLFILLTQWQAPLVSISGNPAAFDNRQDDVSFTASGQALGNQTRKSARSLESLGPRSNTSTLPPYISTI